MFDDNIIHAQSTNGNERFTLKAKVLDIIADVDVVILNTEYAMSHGIFHSSRVNVKSDDKEAVAIVDTTNTLVKKNEVGFFRNFADTMKIKNGLNVTITPLPAPHSVELIKKKINNQELEQTEICEIVKDIVDNKIGDVEISALITALYAYKMTDKEIIGMINAILNTGKTLDLGLTPIADKHCIGGVAGNRTTMIIVPIVAAAGIYMPKTSSRAITSAAGTADTMEVLANVSFNIDEMKNIVKKINGCIVWGGAVNLAAADDKLIKIRHPLRLDPEGLLLASILAKKKSVNTEHLLVDIPVGNGAKIQDVQSAQKLAEKFNLLGSHLKINTKSFLSDGNMPIGNGIGPILECIDVLKVLENDKTAPQNLKEKSCILAGKIIEMTGKCNNGEGYGIAKNILESGKALQKMKEIVEAQGGDKNISSKRLVPSKYTATVYADCNGNIAFFNNRVISKIARIAGAPDDKGAGVFIYNHSGNKIKKGHALFEIYSSSETLLSEALKYVQKTKELIIVRDFVLEA